MRLRPGTAQPGEGEAQEDPINVYKSLKAACNENRARLCSVVSSARIRGSRHKLEHEIHLNNRKQLTAHLIEI